MFQTKLLPRIFSMIVQASTDRLGKDAETPESVGTKPIIMKML